MRGVYATFNEVGKSSKTGGIALPSGALIVNIWRGPVPTQTLVVTYIADADGTPLLPADTVTDEMVTLVRAGITMLKTLGPVKPPKK